MSKKDSSSSSKPSKDDKAPDLSALDFGPAWARKDTGGKPKRRSDHKEKAASKGRGGQDRDRKPKRHVGNKRDGDRRREGKPSHHQRRDHKPETQPAEGVSARIMPIEEGMDALAKEISAQGRTHSVFDLAWLVLGGLDRFHVIFEIEEGQIYQCKKDHSVWLTKSECLRHFWSAGVVKDLYDEEITEGEAPSGNFQSVARCGLSGKLIGPPNHHSFQQALLDLHRERFGNMSFDRYKSKIVMEHGEEAVEKWLEQVKKQSVWHPKALSKDEPVQQQEAEEKMQPSGEEAVAEDAVTETPEPTVEVEPTETPVSDENDTIPVFKTRREVEQHFLTSGFDHVYNAGKNVSVLANVPQKLISPELMATLRHVVAEEKRYPGKLASFLCRQMSGRHLAVFKWKKRLHCGPARPRQVPDDMVMADRPSKLFHWVLDHPSGNLDKMWKDCLPDGIEDDTRHAWYHDLHWLINEGLVLLFSDGTLHAAKEQKHAPAVKPRVKNVQKPDDEEVAKPQAEPSPNVSEKQDS
jgi:hypothetical protein